MRVLIAHEQGRPILGELPAGTTVEVLGGPGEPLPAAPDRVDFWVPPFLANGSTVHIVDQLPGLSVIQLLTAGADPWIGRLAPKVILCDARGVHTSATAEWVLTAILSYLRAFPVFVRQQAERRWAPDGQLSTDQLAGKRVLIVGSGDIGEATAARLAPFDVSVTRVARTARPGVHGVTELPDLLPTADIVVLLVPLTEATRRLVDAAFLARMPDGSLLVNASRGPVVDPDALVAELATGRIGAVVDVTEPEPLPADSPLWAMPNFLLTPHVGGSVRGLMDRAYRLVGQQIRRYAAGEPLLNVVHDGY